MGVRECVRECAPTFSISLYYPPIISGRATGKLLVGSSVEGRTGDGNQGWKRGFSLCDLRTMTFTLRGYIFKSKRKKAPISEPQAC